MTFVRICPIIAISCVTGHNLDLLLKFLQVLPPSNHDREKLANDLAEFQVIKIFVRSNLIYEFTTDNFSEVINYFASNSGNEYGLIDYIEKYVRMLSFIRLMKFTP